MTPENLDQLPVKQRPKMIPMFPRGIVHFRDWRSLRWFLVLTIPVFLSTGTTYWRGHTLVHAAVFGLFGMMSATWLFIDLSSGMSSSNHGTFFRRREPIQYWCVIGAVAAFYLCFIVVGFFI
jgi:hypothetical protein